jgi:multiple sugar transport system ATP-binding protein
MPKITLRDVRKDYGAVRPVIPGISLDIDDGEFVVLVGPSGCGKSTLLRMIAGLVELDGGAIEFGGVDVSRLDPRRRDVAFMFQTYALYPHMTIERNIAFPLVIDRFRWYHYLPGVSVLAIRKFAASAAIAAKVDEVCRSLGLEALRRRRPKDLSGGQRQRVALGRALVRNPAVFLLDEPLSNLDAKMRVQIRTELVALQRELATTFIYVTHDQVEAMTMADRVAVLDRGSVLQFDTPAAIYDAPANLFVARFIGSPEINVVAPELIGRSDRGVVLGFRPTDVALVRDRSDGGCAATVIGVEDHGSDRVYAFTLDRDLGRTELRAQTRLDLGLIAGDQVAAVFDARRSLVFDAETGERLAIETLETVEVA